MQMISAVALAMRLTIVAPRELRGAALVLDGVAAGALRDDGSATIAVPPRDEHMLVVRSSAYRAVEKQFHDGVAALCIRVLREEVVRIAAGGVCRCVRGDYAPSPQWDVATAIFLGHVAAAEGTKIRFDVTEQWKGKTAHQIVVTTWPVGGPYCGLAVQPGAEYLVWAWGPQDALRTDACTRTRTVAEAADDLRWLRWQEQAEPHRRSVALDRRDADVIAAALRPPRAYEWCAPDLSAPATAATTAWYRYRQDLDELPERIRLALEDQGQYALAALAPQLMPAVIERNDREAALLGRRGGRVGVTLPAYDPTGNVAVVYVEIRCPHESAAPAAFVFLRRQRAAWRAVAFSR